MVNVLGKYLDALYLSISFEFPDHLKKLLTVEKEAARDSADDLRLFTEYIAGIPGGAWYIRPTGSGKYQYVLENASLWIAFSTWANMPALQIQFKAETLYEYEADALGTIVDTLVRFFIGPELAYTEKVSRCDVAVDFQSEDFELPEMEDVVTRARHRAVYYRNSTPNTLTLGKRNQALQAQIYCKSEELQTSEKAWMYHVWEQSEGFRSDWLVWRAELRMFREGLHQFDISTLDELLASLGDLADYAVGGAGSWVRVVDEASRGHRASRRPNALWWDRVVDAFRSDSLRSGRKRKGYDPLPSYTRCVELAGSLMARAASLARLGGYSASLSPESFGRHLGRDYERILKEKQTSWSEKINLKTAELRTIAWGKAALATN